MEYTKKSPVPSRHLLVQSQQWNTKTMREVRSKLAIRTPERRHYWRRPGVFIVNFWQISHFTLVLLLLNLNKQIPAWTLQEVRQLPTVKAKLCKNIFEFWFDTSCCYWLIFYSFLFSQFVRIDYETWKSLQCIVFLSWHLKQRPEMIFESIINATK